jgi:outer membrane immunogenic protein
LKNLVFAAAILVGCAGTASAADMPVKAMPVAYYDWSGIYAGVHAGYGGGMSDLPFSSTDFVGRGFLGGAQVGINKQIASFVFGLELDGSWADLKGSQTVANGGPGVGFLISQQATSKIDSLATLAGRAGLAADRWFVFAKGGLAYAHEKLSLNASQTTFPPGASLGIAASGNESRFAPMVGFGAEYALGGNWSVKGEYDYIYLGIRNPVLQGTLTTNGVAAPLALTAQIDQAIHVAKVGVNYRLGGLQSDPVYAPVPARPGYNWSGGYIGAEAGYGLGHTRWPDASSDGKFDIHGELAGVTIGANAQAGSLVFGVEGEWMWTGLRGGQAIVTGANPARTTNIESKANWLAIAAARAGFVVADRLMIYGKAGVAIAEERHTFNFAEASPGNLISGSLGANAVHTGAVGGVGAEYALGGNWSAKIEYDYIRMMAQAFSATGSVTSTGAPLFGAPIAAVQRADGNSQDMHLVKVGVNYHFNPVSGARY